MEYGLNALSTVSQVTAPAVQGLQDALVRALTPVAAPLQRMVPDVGSPIANLASDVSIVAVVLGAAVLAILTGFFSLHRA